MDRGDPRSPVSWSGVGRADRVAAEVIRALRAAGDPVRREFAPGYFPTAMEHLGVTTPALRAIVRPLLVAARANPEAAVALVFALHGSGEFEARQAAFDLLDHAPTVRRRLSREHALHLAAGNDNWCSVDTFACVVGGRAWREGTLTDVDIAAWSASPNRWDRRTALVCTVPLNMKSRGGKGDVARTLVVCARHAAERDDMVVKALSWALRAALEHDRAAVGTFLVEHADVLAARVKREVGNKLRTGLKNPG